jgi:hypothetical protein
MRRWRERLEEGGYSGLGTAGKESPVRGGSPWRQWKTCCGCVKRDVSNSAALPGWDWKGSRKKKRCASGFARVSLRSICSGSEPYYKNSASST